MNVPQKSGAFCWLQIFTRREGDPALNTPLRHSSEVLSGFEGWLNFGSEIGLVGPLKKGLQVLSFLHRQRGRDRGR